MSFRLPQIEEKSQYVLEQFERIASGYDSTNDVISFGMHRLWKKEAVDALNVKAGGKYLDVCCGTGDLALKIAKQAGQEGEVVGLDFSASMLTIAQQRSLNLSRTDCAKVNWIKGDAQNMPFTDDTFDGAIVAFGLRNLSNLQTGVNEMSRVVKPGGKIINLDLGHPTAPIFTPLYFFFFQQIVPLLGKILQNDAKAYTYLPVSLSTYPKPEGISVIFEKAGLKNIKYKSLAMGSIVLHEGRVG